MFNYTEADQRLDALNALDPRNVGGLNAQEAALKSQNIQACRGATNCIDDVNKRYDRQVSDRSEAVLTTINAINAYSQCTAGDTGCVSGSLVQMKAVQADLKAKGASAENVERLGLTAAIGSAEATLGNTGGFLEAVGFAAAGGMATSAGSAGTHGIQSTGIRVPAGASEYLEFKDFNQAQNAALDWLSVRGFKAENTKIGKLGDGYGGPIGMQTSDGKIGFRVEYDDRSGAHINVWAGKEKGPHFTFEGDQSMVNQITKQYKK